MSGGTPSSFSPRATIRSAPSGKGRCSVSAFGVGALMTRPESRGCPMVNAAIELPDPEHPGRKVIEQHKLAIRDRLAAACRKAGLAHPELLADQIHMLVEGAGVCLQSVGPDGPSHRLVRIVESLLESAEKAPRRR